MVDQCTLHANVRVMVFNATFNNIAAISWRPVLLVVETGQPCLFRFYPTLLLQRMSLCVSVYCIIALSSDLRLHNASVDIKFSKRDAFLGITFIGYKVRILVTQTILRIFMSFPIKEFHIYQNIISLQFLKIKKRTTIYFFFPIQVLLDKFINTNSLCARQDFRPRYIVSFTCVRVLFVKYRQFMISA